MVESWDSLEDQFWMGVESWYFLIYFFCIFEILKHYGTPKRTDSHPCTLAAASGKGPWAWTRAGVGDNIAALIFRTFVV